MKKSQLPLSIQARLKAYEYKLEKMNERELRKLTLKVLTIMFAQAVVIKQLRDVIKLLTKK